MLFCFILAYKIFCTGSDCANTITKNKTEEEAVNNIQQKENFRAESQNKIKYVSNEAVNWMKTKFFKLKKLTNRTWCEEQKPDNRSNGVVGLDNDESSSYEELSPFDKIISIPFQPIQVFDQNKTNESGSPFVTIKGGNLSDFSVNKTDNGRLELMHLESKNTFRMKSFEKIEFDTGNGMISLVTKTINQTDYAPEIFKIKTSRNVEHDAGSTSTASNTSPKSYKDLPLSTCLPVMNEITLNTSAPEILPLKHLMDAYFENIESLLDQMETKQKKENSLTVYISLAIFINKNEYLSSIAPVTDNIVTNKEYTHYESIDSKNTKVEAPFNIIYPLTNLSYTEISNEEKLILQSYIPTHIEKNCVFKGSLITLHINDGIYADNVPAESKPTKFGLGNIFEGTTYFSYAAPGVVTGKNNRFNGFYLAPNVNIRDTNILDFAILYANCKIADNTFIGEKVVIGKNVIINDGVIIEDYVIIQDNVIIERDSYIGHYVYVDKNAIIKERVRIELGVYIGKRAIINDDSVLSMCVDVRDDAVIGESCDSNNIIQKEHGAKIENDFHSDNFNKYEPLNSDMKQKYTGDCAIRNGALEEEAILKKTKIAGHTVLYDNIFVGEHTEVRGNLKICNNVVIGNNNVIGGENDTFENLQAHLSPDANYQYIISEITIYDNESEVLDESS